jgi:hypothetical protein
VAVVQCTDGVLYPVNTSGQRCRLSDCAGGGVYSALVGYVAGTGVDLAGWGLSHTKVGISNYYNILYKNLSMFVVSVWFRYATIPEIGVEVE